ncbi:MAG TPA: type II toxin-antitoxin system VapC family toxin [Ktedonobacteraceae bacterium]
MATYFLDTSAIIKRYIFEPGQAWILSLCNPAQGHDLCISQAALVEVVAAICWRAHEKSISMTKRDRLISVFRQDSEQSYNIWPVTTDLSSVAHIVCVLMMQYNSPVYLLYVSIH